MRNIGLAMLLVACGADRAPPAVVEPPPPPPPAPDLQPPKIDVRIVVIDDTTARLQGTVTDSGKIIVTNWSSRTVDGFQSTSDSLRPAPTKQLAIDIPLPARPWGTLRVSVHTRDSAQNVANWTDSWVSGPRRLGVSIDSVVPVGDTIHQPGLVVLASARGPVGLATAYVVIDEGTATEQRVEVPSGRLERTISPYRSDAVLPLLISGPIPNGRRSFHVIVVDSAGTKKDTTFSRVVSAPSVSYGVCFLAGLAGGETKGVDLNVNGDVAGTELLPSGKLTAMLWRNGQALPKRLGTSATDPSIPTGINDSGDVVGGAMDGAMSFGTVWYASGQSQVLTYGNGTRFIATGDITHTRTVFGSGYLPNGASEGLIALDLDRGFITRLGGGLPLASNERQQYLTQYTLGYTFSFRGFGVDVAFPPLRPGAGDRFGRGYFASAVGIDAAGNVVGALEGEPFISEQGVARYITGAAPGRPSHVSPRGEVVSIAGNAVFIWNKTTGTRRVVVNDPSWSIDAVIRLNDRGDVLAHGINPMTGQQGALVLTPVASQPAMRR